MKVFLFPLFTLALCAQIIPNATIAPEIGDDEVLAVFDDGVKFTMRQFRAVFLALDPQGQRAAMTNRKQWLHQYALMRKLSAMAESDKLHEMPPVKEIIEFQRMVTLSRMQLSSNMNTNIVEGAEINKAYESSKENTNRSR
jgi:hypothetical protein